MLSHWISIVVQFALKANDPHWACEVTHRDPGTAGTYYLYCAQSTSGIEVVSVGTFVPDAKSTQKAAP